MAGKDRGKGRRRPVNRTAGRRPPPTARPNRDPAEDQPLIRDLRRALRLDPMEFVQAVSSIVSVVEPPAASRWSRRAPAESQASAADLSALVESFIGTDIAETTAALFVLAALLTDEPTVARIRRELSGRRQPVPDQLRDLASVDARCAWLMHDTLGDGESVFVELGWPSGARATVSIYIDHAAGTRVKDAFATDGPVEPLLDRYREMMAAEEGDPGALVQVDLADARATIEDALAGVHHADGDPEETWPGIRPFVAMLVGRLPAGGSGYLGPAQFQQPPDPNQAARDFLRSPEASDLTDRASDAAARLLTQYADVGFGHALRWTPRTVEATLTDELPWEDAIPLDVLLAVPDVLTRLVSYSYRVLQLNARDRNDTIAAVQRLRAEFEDECAYQAEMRGDFDELDDVDEAEVDEA
jgi:hypothetical protein